MDTLRTNRVGTLVTATFVLGLLHHNGKKQGFKYYKIKVVHNKCVLKGKLWFPYSMFGNGVIKYEYQNL
jgi:hypothetical protein